MSNNYVNTLKDEVHQANIESGWWHPLGDIERKPEDKLDRNPAELLALIHSEVSEAFEAWAADSFDDKLTHRSGEEVELADTIIRLLDMAAGFGINFVQTSNMSSMEEVWENMGDYDYYNLAFYNSAHHQISQILEAFRKNKVQLYDVLFSNLLFLIDIYAERQGFDIEDAIREKLEFNKNREDHKPENRAKAGGKKI